MARNAALRLVSRAEQCTFLLSQKLLKRGFDAGVVKTVMRELTAANIVNDGRFSRMWLRSRIVSKADTPRRIVAALRAKGIDRGTASEALQECLDSETERALLGRFIKKRFGDMPFDLNGCRAELRGEGFSQGAIRDFGEAAER
ncbi:MAG: recombination regulator RecX [Spirochaetaceae bacterium]|nr:recombination regulator RecX [Spirochaetaceae bacterium]